MSKPFEESTRDLLKIEAEGTGEELTKEEAGWLSAVNRVLSSRRSLPELSDDEIDAIADAEMHVRPADEESILLRFKENNAITKSLRKSLLIHWADFARPSPTVSAILRRGTVSVPQEPEKLERALEKVKSALDKDEESRE